MYSLSQPNENLENFITCHNLTWNALNSKSFHEDEVANFGNLGQTKSI